MESVLASAAPPSPVGEVAETVIALMRSFGRARARLMAESELDWAAQMVLRHLHTHGPMRAVALAETMQSDPSTISRQVAQLVKDGMVERRADPADGRASILVVTKRGDELIAAHGELRHQHFGRMLADWDDADLSTFATLLRRFTDDFEKSSTTMLSEPSALTRARSSEGN